MYSLSQAQLDKALFPVGNSSKDIIRKEAEKLKLPTALKKDSQGICFLGHIDIPEFLSHYTSLTPGSVLDMSGNIIGEHVGALVYTVGQRHGFTVFTHDSERAHLYVQSKDVEKNTITVAPQQPVFAKSDSVRLSNTSLRIAPTKGDLVSIQFRYRQKPLKASVVSVSDNGITLKMEEGSEQPASGQSCVIYQGTHCLGGGIIE